MKELSCVAVYTDPLIIGEGPRFYQGLLYWVDILGRSFYITNPDNDQTVRHDVGKMIGSFAPRPDGSFLLACEDGFYLWKPGSSLQLLHAINADLPEMRFNDGACDPYGRFIGGTMELDCEPDQGQMYQVELDGSLCEPDWGAMTCPNGIDWSADGQTLYFVDSPTGRVDAFDYDVESGLATNRRPAIIFDFEDGVVADGMTMDSKGNLWIALWNGYRVECWDPRTATKLAEVNIPAAQVTACAFAGPELNTLYITTGCVNLSVEEKDSQPLAGALFKCATDATGREATPYQGKFSRG